MTMLFRVAALFVFAVFMLLAGATADMIGRGTFWPDPDVIYLKAVDECPPPGQAQERQLSGRADRPDQER